MSFGFGLGAGLKALNAARLGLQTAGNNVANANTPGYSRQRVDLSAALPFGLARGLQMGSGVDVNGITRLIDDGLERRLRLQSALVGAAEVDMRRFDEIEGMLAEPDGGLSDGLADLFGSISRLQSDPADRALRGGVVQSAGQIAQGFQLLSRRFGDLQGSTFAEVNGLVRTVNERAQAIAALNREIVAIEATGARANDLRDTRAQHLKEIGKLIDTNAIERSSGSVDLLVGGNLLVAGDRVSPLTTNRGTEGTSVMVGGTRSPISIRNGRIAALLRQEQKDLPGIKDHIDRLANNMILEFNRLHTTGMPRSGPFQALTSAYGAKDTNGNGIAGDEPLAQSGLPFPIGQGELYVAVTNRSTGALERTRIALDPATASLRDLAAQIDGIDRLSASVDPTGRLRIQADEGYGFDFSPRLTPMPDSFGSFGGTNPTIGTSSSGPFDLSGQTFPISLAITTGTAIPPVVTTVTLDANEFVNPAAVTVDELVTAFNRDLGTAATATNIGGRLQLRANFGGAAAQLSVAQGGGGTALAVLGMTGATVTGQDVPVRVAVEGVFTGSSNGRLVFEPTGDGTIGVTPGLGLRVLDERGNLVTTVDIGSGYEPGEQIDLGNGVRISLSAGSVSASAGNAFAMDVVADSDTTDVLVGLGMNSFFLGSTAADIAVNPDLVANPDRMAAGLGTASADASNLARFMALRNGRIAELDANTIEDFYADLVGEVGFKTSGARATLAAQDQLLAHLEAEREAVSGVNIDEEMVDMVRFQQSYDAAARFIAVMQQISETLINLGR